MHGKFDGGGRRKLAWVESLSQDQVLSPRFFANITAKINVMNIGVAIFKVFFDESRCNFHFLTV